MNKTERTQQPTLAMINFVGMSVNAVLIFAILLGNEIMLPLRLCMAFAMVATATLVSLDVKNLWLTVGGVISAVALIVANPNGGGVLVYPAYIAAMFLFFRFNPLCAAVVKNWWNGIFAPEKE